MTFVGSSISTYDRLKGHLYHGGGYIRNRYIVKCDGVAA